ncbi:MAG: diguanylate cyclase [Nitrospirae bacterium]|nr:diguanylate cyclase [Nitrospirota bacterium]
MGSIFSFNISALSRTLQSLNVLTDLSYRLYDDKCNEIVASVGDDPLLSAIKRNKRGAELYNEFFSNNFRLALKRKTPFVVQSFTNQYHYFIPLKVQDTMLILVAEAFYTSIHDFISFYKKSARELGLKDTDIIRWQDKVTILSPQKIQRVMTEIQSLLEGILNQNYKVSELNKKWRWAKTIISLAASFKTDATVEDISQEVLSSVLFLFDVDTAAILFRDNGDYTVKVSGGRHSEQLRDFKISANSPIVKSLLATHRPMSILDNYELLRYRLPDDILSMYLFPLSFEEDIFGLLAIFNTILNRDAFQSIQYICRLTAYLCSIRDIGQRHREQANLMNLLYLKTSKLYFLYRSRQQLLDAIVNEAASLVGAEKCSLMLPSNNGYLSVAAIKGINKYLMENVRVNKGEAIAGKVYEEGVPVIIKGLEDLSKYGVKPKTFYKSMSSVSVPLKIGDEVVGVLNLSDKEKSMPFTDEDMFVVNQFASHAAMLIKLSECYSLSEQMRELSITDPLTGLYNRRYFDVRLNEEYMRARRYNLPFSLAIIDIDDFKLFNDTEGHLAGDHILKEIAIIMSSTVRANDIVVRYGGEEFAIIMPQTSSAEAYKVAERLRQAVKNLIPPTWKAFPRNAITVSIGVAMYPESGETIAELIRAADKSLYAAKIRGKDQTVVNTQHAL